MFDWIKSLFVRSVDTVISDFNKAIKELEALTQHHSDKAAKHAEIAGRHNSEAVKAEKISNNLKGLIS